MKIPKTCFSPFSNTEMLNPYYSERPESSGNSTLDGTIGAAHATVSSVLRDAEFLGVSLPMSSTLSHLLSRAVARQFPQQDIAALFKVLHKP